MPFVTAGQYLEYAREVVDTLASEGFYGRGYVAGGDRIAADYIAGEFGRIGLKKYGDSYFQPFDISVNTFPAVVALSVNGVEQTAGADFLVAPGSPSAEGDFKVTTMTGEELLDEEKLLYKLSQSAGRFIAIPAGAAAGLPQNERDQIKRSIDRVKYHPDYPVAGYIERTEDKLTWSGSVLQQPRPGITLASSNMPEVIDSIYVHIESRFMTNYTTQNIISYQEGQHSDSLVVLTAHYDHLGMMGNQALFPGANDNASGIAMLLSLAQHYQKVAPYYTMVFIAFGGEELGLLGSKYFVEHPLFELSNIKFLINFDITGTGDDGIQVVNGKVHRSYFDRLVHLNTKQELLKQVKIRGEACNSDHCIFHRQQVPCFYIYTLGGIRAYHDIYDRAETLPLTGFEGYLKLMTLFVDNLR